MKSRLGVMPGMKSFASAAIIIRGTELMHRIRKSQFDLRDLAIQGRAKPELLGSCPGRVSPTGESAVSPHSSIICTIALSTTDVAR